MFVINHILSAFGKIEATHSTVSGSEFQVSIQGEAEILNIPVPQAPPNDEVAQEHSTSSSRSAKKVREIKHLPNVEQATHHKYQLISNPVPKITHFSTGACPVNQSDKENLIQFPQILTIGEQLDLSMSFMKANIQVQLKQNQIETDPHQFIEDAKEKIKKAAYLQLCKLDDMDIQLSEAQAQYEKSRSSLKQELIEETEVAHQDLKNLRTQRLTILEGIKDNFEKLRTQEIHSKKNISKIEQDHAKVMHSINRNMELKKNQLQEAKSNHLNSLKKIHRSYTQLIDQSSTTGELNQKEDLDAKEVSTTLPMTDTHLYESYFKSKGELIQTESNFEKTIESCKKELRLAESKADNMKKTEQETLLKKRSVIERDNENLQQELRTFESTFKGKIIERKTVYRRKKSNNLKMQETLKNEFSQQKTDILHQIPQWLTSNICDSTLKRLKTSIRQQPIDSKNSERDEDLNIALETLETYANAEKYEGNFISVNF